MRTTTRRTTTRHTAGALALLCLLGLGTAVATPTPAGAALSPTPVPAVSPTPGDSPVPEGSTIPAEKRDALLPAGWRASADVLWTTSGDPTGFHLLAAEARTGYTWRTVATLAEPGFDTDRWIGNACLTGSGKRAMVVYAPRQFANRERLFGRGGFAAVVDMETGRVRKLPRTVSLAHYNPGCGVGESTVLTQSGLSDLGATRLLVYDAATAKEVRKHEIKGQVTAAVPVGDRVVAAGRTGLEEIDPSGRTRTLARTNGAPFSIRPDSAGGVAFLEAHADAVGVARYAHEDGVEEIARGPLTRLELAAGTGGRVFLTGAPTGVGTLPASVRRLNVPAHAEISTLGEAAVTPAVTRDGEGRAASVAASAAAPAEPGSARPVGLQVTLTGTARQLGFVVDPGTRPSEHIADGARPSPARAGGAVLRAGSEAKAAAADADYGGVTTDPDRGCAIARNAASTQVYQPHWKQVEWAANLAVRNALTVPRPAGWKSSGLPAWSPQSMYPRLGLASGTGDEHRVPAQILLGVLAQESNMWQASPHALEGVYGNPLVGNFYGLVDEDAASSWDVRWEESDCGYGVAQVTDGMRQADTSRSWAQKQAVAVDYATNIAAGLRILEDKFNHTWQQNIRTNSGNPKWIENWFTALWAYNSGVQPRDAEYGNTTGCRPSPSCTDAQGNWGLGWFNNPINPEYKATRTPFLNGDHGEGSPSDAARPQDWPYSEKVLGWAAFPIVKEDPFTRTWEAGYRQAWWTDALFRTQVKPPRTLFCDDSNHCDPADPSPCQDPGSRCWWHKNAVYKPSCLGTLPGDAPGTSRVSCGQETMRFDPGTAEPADWNAWYRPNCSLTGVPSGSYVIDDVPADVASPRRCASPPFTNQGTFSFDFGRSADGDYLSKIDFHQIGGGFNGHFWFTHSRDRRYWQTFSVTGTWRLNRQLNGTWARVLVHVPDHGSGTQQATYSIKLGDGRVVQRTVNAKSHWKQQRHRWISLGVFQFNGIPEISLSNLTLKGEGRQEWSGQHNVAWDAVAVQPLPRKPKNFVVAFGDSYASGEGAASEMVNGDDYDRETDMDGFSATGGQNACHRSKWAWIRKATLKDRPELLIGGREQNLDNDLDFHMAACSGAQTENMLAYGTSNEWGQESTGQSSNTEVPQLESGFLDANTTLVTLSIGGNDAGWTDVVKHCAITTNCPATTMPGEDKPLNQSMPERISTKVLPSVQRVIEQIHERAPNAKIILMGYPRLLSNQASCLGTFTVNLWYPDLGIRKSWEAGIETGEAAWLNQTADELAQNTAAMTEHIRTHHVDRIHVWFADPRTYFDGHGLCGSPTGLNHLVRTYTPGESPEIRIPENPWFQLGLSAQSFHPNLTGTTLYANALMDTLRRPEVDQ